MANVLTFDDLRKQARCIENEIDLKLLAYSKLGAGLKTPSSEHVSDTVPLLSEEDTFDTMSLEIEQLLKSLTQVNERLAEVPVTGGGMWYNIRRHKEILVDLSKDFKKINSQHESKRERKDLLHGSSESFSIGGINNRRDIYLKENQHINNSDRLVNEQISIAMETRDHLQNQRQSFKRLQTRFNDISNKYPLINSLVHRINLKKRRDSIILGIVVSLCTILMLFYIFH